MDVPVRFCKFLLIMAVIGITMATQVHIMPNLVTRVDPSFVSFTVDSSVFASVPSWGAFNFSSPRLHTLLRGLSPAIWRIGGSGADFLVFDVPQDKLKLSDVKKAMSMTKQDWDNMVQLSLKCGLRLLFDLDLQQRQGRHWGMSNAVQLLDYCDQQGYGANLDWELGNEPNAYHVPDLTPLTGDQIGEDFATIAKLVKTYPSMKYSRIVGPDVVTVNEDALKIIKGYLNRAGGMVDAVTLHHYYFRGDVGKWTEYINPEHLYTLESYLETAYKAIRNTSHPSVPLWIGETSDAWHSGTKNVSDRYISGFLWLNKLGASARAGVKVVMRQTFWGGYYGLINNSLLPNPDYWLSLAHKRLVGPEVLDVHTSSTPKTTKVYAHCTAHRSYAPGSVTVFMLNVARNHSDLVTFSPDLDNQVMDVYLMTPGEPGNLLSQTVLLNGELLQMVDDHTLPELKPITVPVSQGVHLPPTTYAFVVLPQAQFKPCVQ